MSKMNHKFLVAALSLSGFVACTSSSSDRTVTGTIPSALTAKVKTVRAVTTDGKAVNASVTGGSFSLSLPVARTVLVFVDGNNKVIANLRFARGAGGPLQTTLPAGAAGDSIALGSISIVGKTASAEQNPLDEIDCDGDGETDLADSDDDNDGTDDSADKDDDGDGKDDCDEDLDSDDDGDTDMVDADDDDDGVSDEADADDDGDGKSDADEPDSDQDGVCDSEDADSGSDGESDDDGK
jgi:hypothetical protein